MSTTQKKDTAREQVYTLLRRYNHLTTDQIVDYMYLVFDKKFNKNTARSYRSEYERKHVGLVVEIGGYKQFTHDQKRKAYAYNGDSYTHTMTAKEVKVATPYKISFWNRVRLFFRNGTIQTYEEYARQLETLKRQEV